jgi:mono/diheme cytochrome c family protein
MRWSRSIPSCGYKGAASVVALVSSLAACRREQRAPADTAATSPPPAETSSTPSAPAPPSPVPSPAPPSGAATSAGITPQQIALGDSIFHGQVGGGTCQTCHGADEKGTPLAPDLTDAQWLWGDGSYAFIVRTVTDGVPTPKQHPGAMPPKGGAPLTDEQVRAVAAYVYSLSHPRG